MNLQTAWVRRPVVPTRGTARPCRVILVPLLAGGAADGEWQRAQPLFCNLDVTVQAVSILARLDPAKCLVDAAECLRRPLEEREVDGRLAAGLGVIADITHLGRSAGAPDTLPALHVLVDLMPAVLQELREFCPSHAGHLVQSPS